MPLEEAGAAPATALDVAVGFIMEFKRLLVTCWLVWPGDGAAPAAAGPGAYSLSPPRRGEGRGEGN